MTGTLSDLKVDVQDINRLFRSGRLVYPESEEFKIAKALEGKKLIALHEEQFVKCVREGDDDFQELEDTQLDCWGYIVVTSPVVSAGEGFCPECGRRVGLQRKKIFNRYRIVTDIPGVVTYFRGILGEIAGQCDDGETYGVLLCNYAGERIRTCIVDICESDFYFSWSSISSSPILYVLIDPLKGDATEDTDSRVQLSIAELLLNDVPTKLVQQKLLSAVEIAKDRNTLFRSIDELESDFESFLGHLTPTDFEAFITKFADRARSNPQSLESYERKLNRLRDSLLGAIVRQIGGTGNEDAMVEPKYEYLQPFFSSKSTYEMKKYSGTVELSDLRELLDHCLTANTDGIIYTSGNLVRGTVWNRIRRIKNNEQKWRFIVIDRNLLLELLCELRLTNLIGEKFSPG
jgi:hypothetical protein